MSARVIIKKYTGKDGDFGTEVSSIGLKRIDTCVPSVYSSEGLAHPGEPGKTIPADDASDARMYCIYRPDTMDCHAYSMESVFKIHLIEAPDVQLSNIRIYPVGERPRNPHPAILRIGNSISYSRPTDKKSSIAVNDIWDYSKEHPFYLTVSGVYGQCPDPQLGKTDYVVEYKDFGYGNVICLDGVRQLLVPVATRSDKDQDIVVTFRDNTFLPADAGFSCIEFRAAVEDVHHPGLLIPGDVIPAKYVELDRVTEADGRVRPYIKLKVKVKDEGIDMMSTEPDNPFRYGLFYKIPGDDTDPRFNTGHQIMWVYMDGVTPGMGSPSFVPIGYDPNKNPHELVWNKWFTQSVNDSNSHVLDESLIAPPEKPVEYYDIEVLPDPDCHGHMSYVVNGVFRPHLHFEINKIYRFKNHSGAQFPLRFIGNPHSPVANAVDDVITDGVIVLNGCTNNEELIVNPEAILKAGKCVNAYQCVCHPALGNHVFNHQLFMCGQYNMKRVNGGIYNPLLAGETDYVYLQLDVAGDTDPGYCVPDIMIEYDEN